jgi:hypothetical protein
MENKTSQFFWDYVPANELIEKLNLHQRDLVFRAMRKQVALYYPVKPEKYVTYYSVKKVSNGFKTLFMVLRTFFLPFLGLDHRGYHTGQIIQIRGHVNLNALAVNTLNESLVFSYCFDSDSVIHKLEKLRNKFHMINFDDVLVSIEDAYALREILISEKQEIQLEQADCEDDLIKPKTKQTKREEVFLTWLQGKDEAQVSNIKKEEVWEELQQMDRQLFSVEPRNFFRDQKIITFKSGRKTS